MGEILLGTLGGESAAATDLNNLGQVVGFSQVESGDSHAFLWDPQYGMADLGSLGGSYSRAEGLNDLGQAVGYAFDAEWNQRAVIWSLVAPPVVLDGPAGWIEARSINDDGLVVGLAGNLPVAWPPGESMRELGCVIDLGHVDAVDASGTAVGFSDLPGYPLNAEAQLWHADGTCVALGPAGGVGSRARERNGAGEVVGSFWTVPYGPGTAVRWDPSGVATPLSEWAPEGWTLIEAVDINARGDILCLASDPEGVRQPVILWWLDAAGVPGDPPAPPPAPSGAPGGLLALHPNPSAGAVNLRLGGEASGTARIRIFDAEGRLARQFSRSVERGGSSLRLEGELARLGAGIYLVKIEGPDGTTATGRMVRLAR